MTPAEWKTELAKVPVDRQYGVIERAAIHEYLGGMDRDAAERAALAEWFGPKQDELFARIAG